MKTFATAHVLGDRQQLCIYEGLQSGSPTMYRVTVATYDERLDANLHMSLDFAAAQGAWQFFDSYKAEAGVRQEFADTFERGFLNYERMLHAGS